MMDVKYNDGREETKGPDPIKNLLDEAGALLEQDDVESVLIRRLRDRPGRRVAKGKRPPR